MKNVPGSHRTKPWPIDTSSAIAGRQVDKGPLEQRIPMSFMRFRCLDRFRTYPRDAALYRRKSYNWRNGLPICGNHINALRIFDANQCGCIRHHACRTAYRSYAWGRECLSRLLSVRSKQGPRRGERPTSRLYLAVRKTLFSIGCRLMSWRVS